MYDLMLNLINNLLMSEQFAPFTIIGCVLMIIMAISGVISGSSEESAE